MMSVNAIILSIQPRYAEKIFDGSKAVELRRVRPKVDKGDVALVYVSSPVKAMHGAFSIEKVIVAPLNELWGYVKGLAGITRKEFDAYYEGATVGVGIFIDLSSLRELNTPMELNHLRRNWPQFQPPQSYRYLSSVVEQYTRVPSQLQRLIKSVASMD